MKYTPNYRGALPVLVAVLVVVLAIAAGVAVYHVSKSRQKVTQTAGTSPSPNGSSSATASPVLTPKSVASTYLEIKELGVKIRLTDDIKDVVYGYDSQFLSKYPDPQQVGISSQSLVNASAACKPGAGGPLGTIGKTKNPNQGFGVLTPNNETVLKFGDYFVYYKTPDTACGAPQGLMSKQLQSFEQAFKTVQPD